MTPLEAAIRDEVEGELALELAGRRPARLRASDQDWVYRLVGRVAAAAFRAAGEDPDCDACRETWRRVFGSVTPLGPLAVYLADPDVEEIRLNGTRGCYVLRRGAREEVPPPFDDEPAIVALVHWYCDATGAARLDRSSPAVTLTLPDGSRLHAVLSPPARPLAVTIRRHPPDRFRTLADLVGAGFLDEGAAAFLEAAVRGRCNLLIAGGTGAGKTTLLRALLRAVPAWERIVCIEDQAELNVADSLPDCIALEARAANTEGRGAIAIQQLVHEALRMSPDRIVIGEVRGAEALDLLDAMNTGHPGSICTIHSESARETLPRLARLALRNPSAPRPETIEAEVVRTLDVVVHLGAATTGDRRIRRVRSIALVGEEGVIELGVGGTPPARAAAKLLSGGYDVAAGAEAIA